jgi:hypothetical protein
MVMDIEIKCSDIEVTSTNYYGNSLIVNCINVDTDFLEEDKVINYISPITYVSKISSDDRTELLLETLEYFSVGEIISALDRKDILNEYSLDEILDHFKDNLIEYMK